MKYVVIEWDCSAPKARHLLDVSRGGRLGYAEAKSITAFRRRSNEAFMDNLRCRAFHVYMAPELEGGVGAYEAEAYHFEGLPEIVHETVFVFYNHIGYNHKTKRYR